MIATLEFFRYRFLSILLLYLLIHKSFFGPCQTAWCDLIWFLQQHANLLGALHNSEGERCSSAQSKLTPVTQFILSIDLNFSQGLLWWSEHVLNWLAVLVRPLLVIVQVLLDSLSFWLLPMLGDMSKYREIDFSLKPQDRDFWELCIKKKPHQIVILLLICSLFFNPALSSHFIILNPLLLLIHFWGLLVINFELI